MSEMEEILRGVIGKAVRTNFAGNTAKAYESLYFNSLRESGLLRLLEAGQGIRDCAESCEDCCIEWDVAKAEMKGEKLHAD